MPELTVSIDTSKAVSGIKSYNDAINRMIDHTNNAVTRITTLQTTINVLKNTFAGQSIFKQQIADVRNLSRNINGMRRSIDGLTKASAANAAAMRAQRRQFRLSGAAAGFLRRNLLGLTAGFGIVVGIRSAIKALAEFDQQMAVVGQISGATAEELVKLRNVAIELGQSTIFKPTQVTGGLEQLARAGLNASESLATIPAILDFSTANLISTADATRTTVAALTQFGLGMDQASKVTDVFTKAALTSVTNVQELASSFKFVGPVASAFGITIEETAAVLSTLANAGLRGTLSGAGFRQVLIDLATPTDKALRAFDKLGLSAKELNPAFNNLGVILDRLGDAQEKFSTEQEFLNILLGVFEARSVAAATALIRFRQGVDDQSKALREAANTTKDTATAVQNNLLGSWRRFTAAVDSFVQTSGDKGLTGFFKDLADSATRFVLTLQGVEDVFETLPRQVETLSGEVKRFKEEVSFGATSAFADVQLDESINDAADAAAKLAEENSAAIATLERLAGQASVVEPSLEGLESAYDDLTKRLVIQRQVFDRLGISAKGLEVIFDSLKDSNNLLAESSDELVLKLVAVQRAIDASAEAETATRDLRDSIRSLHIELSLLNVPPGLRGVERTIRSLTTTSPEIEALKKEFRELAAEGQRLQQFADLADAISELEEELVDVVIATRDQQNAMAGMSQTSIIAQDIIDSMTDSFIEQDGRVVQLRKDIEDLTDANEKLSDSATEIKNLQAAVNGLEIDKTLFDVSPAVRASTRAIRSLAFAGEEVDELSKRFVDLSEDIARLEQFERVGLDIGDAFANAASDIVVAGRSIEETVESLGRAIAGIAFEELVGNPIREVFRRAAVGIGVATGRESQGPDARTDIETLREEQLEILRRIDEGRQERAVTVPAPEPPVPTDGGVPPRPPLAGMFEAEAGQIEGAGAGQRIVDEIIRLSEKEDRAIREAAQQQIAALFEAVSPIAVAADVIAAELGARAELSPPTIGESPARFDTIGKAAPGGASPRFGPVFDELRSPLGRSLEAQRDALVSENDRIYQERLAETGGARSFPLISDGQFDPRPGIITRNKDRIELLNGALSDLGGSVDDLFDSTRDSGLKDVAQDLLDLPTGPRGQAGPIPGFPNAALIADAIAAATVGAPGGFVPSANDSDTPLFLDDVSNAAARKISAATEEIFRDADLASIFEGGFGGADVVSQIPWGPLVDSVDSAGMRADAFANTLGSAADSSSSAMRDSSAAALASASALSQVPSATDAVIDSLVRLSLALDQLASKLSGLSDQPSQPNLPRPPDQREREREVGFDPRNAASTQVSQGLSASAFGQEDRGLLDRLREEFNLFGPAGREGSKDPASLFFAGEPDATGSSVLSTFGQDIPFGGTLEESSNNLAEAFLGLAATTEKVLPGIEGIGGLGLGGVRPPGLPAVGEPFSRGAGPFTAESAVGMFAGPGFDPGATPGFNVMTDNPLEPVVNPNDVGFGGSGVDIGGALAGIAGGVAVLAPLLTGILGVDQETAQLLGLVATGITAMILLLQIIAALSAVPFFQHGTIATSATPGIFGEAGPEAVLPLRRGPSGDLGVQVNGGGGGGSNFNIINNIRTPDASSFRKSRRQVNRDQARSIRGLR